MRFEVVVAAAAALALLAGVVHADVVSYDCKIKQTGLDFAQSLQPFRPLSSFQVRPCCPCSVANQHCSPTRSWKHARASP
jgi:hypothetical protein